MKPFDGVSEMNGNIVECKIWHCHGCNGELRTYWKPYQEWETPNDSNFKHDEGCKFLQVKRLIEKAFENSNRNPFVRL